MDAAFKSREKGADSVKQWDASLDGKTRPHHRELDEPFKCAGMEVMQPGGFGIPSEDCNCRCSVVLVPRWALGNSFTKWDEETGGIVEIKAKDYNDFKMKYAKESERVRSNVQKMKMAAESSIDWGSKGFKITKEQYKDLMKYARLKDIELSDFKQYDGDVKNIIELIDDANSVASLYPEITKGKKKLTISLSETMDNMDFARTNGHIISINANAYRNIDKLASEYQKLVDSNWFVSGTDYHAIIKHELGHVVFSKYNIDILGISKEITGLKRDADIIEFVSDNISEYAGAYSDGREIISECFSSVYNSTKTNEFALKFVEKCGKIIKKERM